jgi:putative transcriptional regulator
MSQIKRSMSDLAILNELGRRLKQARLEQNITQQQIAEGMGVSRATYIRLEDGNGKLEVLVAALRVLGKLPALDAFLPDEPYSPIAALKSAGHIRQRARPGNKPVEQDKGDLDW